MSDPLPVWYLTPDTVYSLAQHIGQVIASDAVQELESRASVFLLDTFKEMPPQWRELSCIPQDDAAVRVSLAIALGMCSHPDNNELDEDNPDPRATS